MQLVMRISLKAEVRRGGEECREEDEDGDDEEGEFCLSVLCLLFGMEAPRKGGV